MGDRIMTFRMQDFLDRIRGTFVERLNEIADHEGADWEILRDVRDITEDVLSMIVDAIREDNAEGGPV